MKMIWKFFKFIFLFILSVIALIAIYILLINITQSKTHYECNGNLKGYGKSELYLSIEDYGPFVFYNDSFGRIKTEIPNLLPMDNYFYLEDLGDLIHIYKISKSSGLSGSFSLLSKDIMLDTPFGFFDGRCKKIEL
jgi:hypothetical protein|tara:strand:- start:16 stop:423 length:408 start_codon:yes stop_codon:yes gene_type:complete